MDQSPESADKITTYDPAPTADLLSLLKPFVDISSTEIIKDAVVRATIDSHPMGSILFKRDQNDDYITWLLSGSIDLLDSNFDMVSLSAADIPLADAVEFDSPHNYTAVTTSVTQVLKLKRSFVELALRLAKSGNYMITSVEESHTDESDWMSAMLSSPLFDFLPAGNIQKLFSHFEEIELPANDVVITQGEIGDYFYVIKSGRTRIEYMTGSKTIPLAELGPGECFGEDALISEVPRNATITMVTNGSLMRLAADDFEKLLRAPVTEKISQAELAVMFENTDSITWLLDVRTRFEFQADNPEHSVNIPILKLRDSFNKLDLDATYVVTSAGDKRAELATYILLENGYNAYVLSDNRTD